MPIGIGAAMLIGSAVAGGSAVAAAKMQSNAANKAVKAQQAATDKAINVQQQANQPYMDLGRQAAGRLSQMPQQPYTQQFGAGSNGYQPFQPSGGTLGALGQPQGSPYLPMAFGAPQGGYNPNRPFAEQLGETMSSQTEPGIGPGMPPQSGMVRLQAPDGSMTTIPDGPMVQQFLAKGARRLN